MTDHSPPPDAHDRAAGGAVGADTHRAMVESAPVPVFAVDTRREVSLVNAAARALFPSLAAGAPLAGAVPRWLADADARRSPGRSVAARGRVGDGAFTARATPLPGGHTAWWLSDVTRRETARRSLRSAEEHTAFLVRTSARLQSSLNPRRCAVVTAELAAGELADAAVVVLPPRRHRLPLIRVAAGRPPEEELLTAAPDKVPGLAEALVDFPPGPSRRADPDRLPEWLPPAGFGRPGAVLVVPLPGSGTPAGALVLLRRAARDFDGEEDTFARLFAARAGAALSAAALYEEQVTTVGVLQRELLPPDLPRLEYAQLAGVYRPAQSAQRVGGDFYDVRPATGPGQETGIVLGDVTGKGPEAAVLTGRIRHTLAALRLVEADHGRLLDLLNSALLGRTGNRFATLVLASVEAGGGSGEGGNGGEDSAKDAVTGPGEGPGTGVTVRLTSAGHPPPLIVRDGGEVETAATHGTLVGVLPKVSATTYTTVLRPGETCLLYSDGVTEARGGPRGDELFGEERLADALASCTGMPAEAVVERVLMLTSEWLAGQEHGDRDGREDRDDIAMVAITAPHRAPLRTMGTPDPERYLS
ncbi:serine/threonine protein phosphatase [Streptomyces carminius]|uniref:Serine/threonine protein phosphatase n=1 Tax=Streptomyces carminius TaxID=2665496 RepID=A0A2M8LTI7_9ACTN|nr:SpoIIE family protein phosphatase [Streptomyces carminius]PJE95264.1 serine/threonine protein phosphatase [Streptomyces carminius]